MRQLVRVRQYGVGTTTYTRDISPETANERRHKSWLEMSEQERIESNYASNVSHIRSRMITRAKSKQYLYHAVFTTTDTYLRRNIKQFSEIVYNELKSQGISPFLFFEVNHKQEIWKYDDDSVDAKKIIEKYGYTCFPRDSVENAFGCYNRRAFAPLAENNDMHIHALLDRPVDFTHYVKNVECNPNNLYCELFYKLHDYIYNSTAHKLDDLEFYKEESLNKNINYMSKLTFYTKSKMPKNMQMYKTDNKKVESLDQTFILDEYGEILYTIKNDFNYENAVNINRENRNQNRIEINSFDFEKSDYYKSLDDEEKCNFQISYIKSLDELNNQYKAKLNFYKSEIDFLKDKSLTFTNFISLSVLDFRSVLDFDVDKFVAKYKDTYYTDTINTDSANTSNSTGNFNHVSNNHSDNHNSLIANVIYPLFCLFFRPIVYIAPVLLLLYCPFASKLEKSVIYEYRGDIAITKIYVLRVLNRVNCKRYKRKKRKLKVKKSIKYKFMVMINCKFSMIVLNSPFL